MITPQLEMVKVTLRITAEMAENAVMEAVGNRLAQLSEQDRDTMAQICLGQTFELLARGRVWGRLPENVAVDIRNALNASFDTFEAERASRDEAKNETPAPDIGQN